MTYSLPLIDEDGTILGVFTADISLQWLERSLVSLPLGHYGEPVLLSEKGMFVDCSREEWRMKESLGSLADSHTGADRQIFLDLMQFRLIDLNHLLIVGGDGTDILRTVDDFAQ